MKPEVISKTQLLNRKRESIHNCPSGHFDILSINKKPTSMIRILSAFRQREKLCKEGFYLPYSRGRDAADGDVSPDESKDTMIDKGTAYKNQMKQSTY